MPEGCVVVEDAPAGVEAAHAGGMRVIAVATTHAQEKLESADTVVAYLSDIQILPTSYEPRSSERLPNAPMYLTVRCFYPGKNLGAYGDGGAITTSDPELNDKVRVLRYVGQHVKFVHEVIGFQERLDPLQAAILSVKVDFFSIGTNDLSQYTLAADRTNAQVAPLATGFQPAVLRLVRDVIAAAHAQGKWVSLCSELAGESLAIPILPGLGLDEFSMNPPAIPLAKQIIRTLTLDEAREVDQAALELDSPDTVRALVRESLFPIDMAARLAALVQRCQRRLYALTFTAIQRPICLAA